MAETLCQRKALLNSNPEDYARLVARARFVCRECGRSARKKKHLCKPARLDDLLQDRGR